MQHLTGNKLGAYVQHSQNIGSSLMPSVNPSISNILLQTINQDSKEVGPLGAKRVIGKGGPRILDERVAQAAQRVRSGEVPGRSGQILAGARVGDDTLQLTRNFIDSISVYGQKDPVSANLGYPFGVVTGAFSVREIIQGTQEYRRSKEIGDTEGKSRAVGTLVSGSLVTAGTAAYLSSQVAKSMEINPIIAASATVSSRALFGIGSLVGLVVSILGIVRCVRFENRLNEFLQSGSDLEKTQAALRFLKEMLLSETPQEAEARVKYLKRRCGNDSVRSIVENADRLLEALEKGSGLEEAKELIATVQMENKVKRDLYSLGAFASLASVIAFLVSVFVPGMIFVSIALYSVASTIFLLTSLYAFFGHVMRSLADSLAADLSRDVGFV